MGGRKPLTDEDGEVRELDELDFASAIPFSQLPQALQDKLARRNRGPQKTPTKQQVTLRLSRDVVEQFRATGSGWQTRIDTALKEWLASH